MVVNILSTSLKEVNVWGGGGEIYWENPLQNDVRYSWILLADELVPAITEKDCLF